MDRWDFDCQRCYGNISNAFFSDRVWYVCPQSIDVREKLQAVYPIFRFDKDGEIVEGELPPTTEAVEGIRRNFLRHYSDFFSRDGTIIATGGGGSCIGYREDPDCIDFTIEFPSMQVFWHYLNREGEYFEKACLVKHDIRGRGRGRMGFAFDVDCAEQLEWICSLCDTRLERVPPEEQPRDSGIVDRFGGNIRGPRLS